MAVLPEGVGLDVTLQYVEKPTRTFLIDWSSNRSPAWMKDFLQCVRMWRSSFRMNGSGGRSIHLILEVNWKAWWEKNGIISRVNFPAGSKMHFPETAGSLRLKILYLRKKYRES